jgi:PAS domain S-box-containing protein
MPVALASFARQRRDFPYPWLLWLFAAFIMACGTTHLMGAIVLWKPLYELDALLKIVTAVVSVACAVVLWPLLPHALKLPSPNQLQQANEKLLNEIAERKHAEEALRLAKEAAESNLQKERMLMAAIVESSEDAIIGKSLDGIVTSWNRGAEKLFGYTAKEIAGHTLRTLIPPEIQSEEEMLLATIRRGESIKHFETERVCKDGRRVAVSITISPIHDNEGRIIGASKIARDITERKQAEENIRQLNANLEHRVIERTAELSSANNELDSFSYAVSHDLRGPLRALSGFSQALQEDYGNQLQGEARVYLEQIDIASRKMGELVDGILALSRSTRGELQRDAIDISSLATQILQELTRDEQERKIDWQVEPDLHATGDIRMIEAVLRNLLGNARKYTGKTATPSIRVFSGEVNGQPGFCISDNGAGFDMSHANRLFQPFQRLHRQEEFPGTGIGLATVQRIVHRHGGVIEAWGEPGKGALFKFTLSSKPADVAIADKEQ